MLKDKIKIFIKIMIMPFYLLLFIMDNLGASFIHFIDYACRELKPKELSDESFIASSILSIMITMITLVILLVTATYQSEEKQKELQQCCSCYQPEEN